MMGKYGGFSFGGQQPSGVNPYRQMAVCTTFPNGAKSAILLTFDVEGCYSNGVGDEAKEVANYKRICEKIQRCGITATFCVVGQMAEDYGPEFVNRMLDSGCEVASHGYWHDLDRAFDEDKIYAGQYGPEVNAEQVKRGVEAIEKIKSGTVNGFRLPYGYFNEFSYQAIEEVGLKWTSHVGIDDFVVPGQGYGPMPFRMQLGAKIYDMVEIPMDSQTYDWSVLVADEKANTTFVDAARAYCESRGIEFNRTPAGAVRIWKQRISDAIEQQSIFTFLCHPINLVTESEKWDDAVEEFLFPVIEYLGQLYQQDKIWVCTCNELADFYKTEMKSENTNVQ